MLMCAGTQGLLQLLSQEPRRWGSGPQLCLDVLCHAPFSSTKEDKTRVDTSEALKTHPSLPTGALRLVVCVLYPSPRKPLRV